MPSASVAVMTMGDAKNGTPFLAGLSKRGTSSRVLKKVLSKNASEPQNENRFASLKNFSCTPGVAHWLPAAKQYSAFPEESGRALDQHHGLGDEPVGCISRISVQDTENGDSCPR